MDELAELTVIWLSLESARGRRPAMAGGMILASWLAVSHALVLPQPIGRKSPCVRGGRSPPDARTINGAANHKVHSRVSQSTEGQRGARQTGGQGARRISRARKEA